MELKMPSDLTCAEPKREIVAHNNPAASVAPRVDPRRTLGLHRINSEKSTVMNKQWALKRRSIEDKYRLAALPIVFLCWLRFLGQCYDGFPDNRIPRR
jgi:hypothetical protein